MVFLDPMIAVAAPATAGKQAPDFTTIAHQFAPVFTAARFKNISGSPDALCPYNIPTRVDFDGNWDVTDNERHYDALLHEHPTLQLNPSDFSERGVATIYYEAIASRTHLFLTYYLYYPHDAGDDCVYTATDAQGRHLGGHLHDSSSVMLIVARAGGLEWAITSDHGTQRMFRASDLRLYAGKPVLRVSNASHYMVMQEDGHLPGIDTHYLYGAADPYRLAPIHLDLWARRHSASIFGNFLAGVGLRFREEANPAVGDRGPPPWAPWARPFAQTDYIDWQRGTALSFVDPIAVFQNLYVDFSETDFSHEYAYNPYTAWLPGRLQ